MKKVNIYKQFYTANGSEVWEGKDVPLEKIREVEDKFYEAWVKGLRDRTEVHIPIILEEVSAASMLDDSVVLMPPKNKITFRMIKRIPAQYQI